MISFRLLLHKCPKLEQLRDRMLRRKRNRRLLKSGLDDPSLHNKQRIEEDTLFNLTENNKTTNVFIQQNKSDPEENLATYNESAPVLQNRHQSTYTGREDDDVGSIQMLDQEVANTNNLFQEGMTERLSPDRSKPQNSNSIKDAYDVELNDDAVVNIELIYCQHCKKSYAPATYQKFCQALNEDGVPKCIAKNKKRRVYNSARVRITSNAHLNVDEQRQVVASRKKVVSEMREKALGKRKPKKKNTLWRQQSDDFRKAMETNRLITKAEKEGRPAHYYL
jgi:hypothetical protein